MATLTQVTLTCDVCGKAKDIQTRTIGLDGATYEIDLCPKDYKGLSQAAAEYVSNARATTARPAPAETGTGQAPGPTPLPSVTGPRPPG